MKIKQYWIVKISDQLIGVYTAPEQLKRFSTHEVEIVECPMIDCARCGTFPRLGGDECPVCGDGQDPNYHLEIVVDTTNFDGLDGDQAWEFPSSYETPGMQIRPDLGHFFEPHGVSGPYSEVEEKWRTEVFEEWRNLVVNNEFIGQKIKLTFDVQRVCE